MESPVDNPPAAVRRVPVGLFVVLMVLDTSVFVLDKVASQRAMVVRGPFYLHVVLQPWIWMAFALGPAQLFVWTRILKRIDLSLAYPLTTISYLATMVVSEVVFKETLGVRVWVGAILIMAGVGVLGRTPKEADRGA